MKGYLLVGSYDIACGPLKQNLTFCPSQYYMDSWRHPMLYLPQEEFMEKKYQAILIDERF
jgi:hypothetical protein